jgi:hypothetical protein
MSYIKKRQLKFYLLIVLFIIVNSTQAQITNSAIFIKGGKNDAVKIISAYILPIERTLCFNGANNNMLVFKNQNNKELNIGLGLDITTSYINNNDNTFDINNLYLDNFEAKNPDKTIAQTYSGNENTITIQTKDKYRIPSTSYPFYSEKPILSLDSPKGKNKTNIPFPLLHLFAEKSGNLIELKLIPPFKIENSTIGLFDIGINIQHNLETSLKFLSDFFVDVYVSGGYNYNRIINYLNIKPNEDAITFSDQSENGPYDNQEFHIVSKSIPLRINFIKSFNKISIFASGAYNAMNSLVKMTGKYPVYKTDPTNQFQIIINDIEYTRDFNKFSLDTGINYQSKNFIIGLKYTHSYYKNIDLSIGYIL